MAAVSQQHKRELPTAMDASTAAAATAAALPTAAVAVSPADAARDPRAAVAALHSARVSSLAASSSSSPSAVAEDGDWGVTELFRAVAEDEGLAKTVSLLNDDDCNGHLIFFFQLIKIGFFCNSPISYALPPSATIHPTDPHADCGKRRLDPAACAREVPRHGKWIEWREK